MTSRVVFGLQLKFSNKIMTEVNRENLLVFYNFLFQSYLLRSFEESIPNLMGSAGFYSNHLATSPFTV
jgi:hypothetical protein